MILLLAATEIEMNPFLAELAAHSLPCCTLITGVGPVETTLRFTRYLTETKNNVELVVNFGVGGAYVQSNQATQPKLLDICLAESEVAGDFGISLDNKIEYLDKELTGEIVFTLDKAALINYSKLLDTLDVRYHIGRFVTVNSISGTLERGEMLRKKWFGVCENMEGASVARVCKEFSIPWLELRCISNLVEDRDPAQWQLQDACCKAAVITARLIRKMIEQ